VTTLYNIRAKSRPLKNADRGTKEPTAAALADGVEVEGPRGVPVDPVGLVVAAVVAVVVVAVAFSLRAKLAQAMRVLLA